MRTILSALDGPRIRQLLSSRSLQNIGKNSLIQAIEQLGNIVFGLLVTAYIARYFGPADFGLWSLAISAIYIASTGLKFGLDIIILRQVSGSETAPERFVTEVIILRLVNSLCFVFGCIAILGLLSREPSTTAHLIFIFVLGLLFVPLETIEFFFRGRQDAVVPATARLTAIIIGSCLKLGLIMFGATMVQVAWAHSLQLGLTGAVLLAFYFWRGFKLILANTVVTDVKNLYLLGWPLFVAHLGALVYQRLDIFMLSALKGGSDVGTYAAATRITEAAYLAPVILMTAISPVLFGLYKRNMRQFIQALRICLTAFNIIFISIAVFISLLSPFIIHTLFGQAYTASAQLLSIHILTLIFMAQTVATDFYWVARRRQRINMIRTLAGASTTAILNLILIPTYGALGAAIAALVSSFVSGVGIHFFLGRNGFHLLRLQFVPKLLPRGS